MNLILLRKSTGVILIIAMWCLSFLTILAIGLSCIARQKITLTSRVEERSRLHFTAEACVKKAVILINQDFASGRTFLSARIKAKRHNNAAQSQARLNDGECELSYDDFDNTTQRLVKRPGVCDEEGKININTADAAVLSTIFRQSLGCSEEEARSLARAIIDWREFGENELTGFYNQDYYSNLEFPYPLKNEKFEVLEELLLVKGMNEDIFNAILPYITIYGEGRINVNTASEQVLVALGLNRKLVGKILSVRRGADGREATEDDFIFNASYDIAGHMQENIDLEQGEAAEIDALNAGEQIGTASRFFRIQSTSRLRNKNAACFMRCVYDTLEHSIVSCREEFKAS